MNAADLLKNNADWAAKINAEDPEFFPTLAKQQAPEFLWIGCSDSRVPANQIVGMLPGSLFVHRNIANVVMHTDINCLSVMNFAIDVLKVKHVIVCGHYGCGGVKAAMGNQQFGVIDNWIRHIRDIYFNKQAEVDEAGTEEEKLNKLCELNVVQQVANVCHSSIVQNAWHRGQDLTVHGWIYGIHDGLLKTLTSPAQSADGISDQYKIESKK